jgi:hypothetical protein
MNRPFQCGALTIGWSGDEGPYHILLTPIEIRQHSYNVSRSSPRVRVKKDTPETETVGSSGYKARERLKIAVSGGIGLGIHS